jgi:CheY-like chemotaxis protein
VILGNLETLERRLGDGHELHRLVAAALGGAARAAELTERLMVFAHRPPPVPEVVSPNRLVAGLADRLRRVLGDSIAMEMVLTAPLWNIFVDPGRFENALIKLALNARDAMADGGTLTIETANRCVDDTGRVLGVDWLPGDYVGISVRDSGCGMSPAMSTPAFAPSFTAEGVSHGGGLDLSQVTALVTQSGGHLTIDSTAGAGTSVTLYFPRHQRVNRTRLAPADPTVSQRNRRGGAVLVVEDDPGVRRYTVDVIRELGYDVISAGDAPVALQLLGEHPGVGLLFTDVGLPGGMTGRQLADEAIRRQPSLKILFTTGYGSDVIMHKGRLDPGANVVFKPFTYTDLASKMRRVLER